MQQTLEQILKFSKLAAAFAAACCAYFFGEVDNWLTCFLFFIMLDYFTGIIAAFIEKALSSKVGAVGIAKKVLLLIIVALAHRLDIVLGANGVLRCAVLGFYIANEGLSILENAARCGIAIPAPLASALAQLKNGKNITGPARQQNAVENTEENNEDAA